MAGATYKIADTAVNIGNLLGQKIYEQIPSKSWDRLDPFAEYLVELHGSAMRHIPTGVLVEREFKKRLSAYDARLKRFLCDTALFSETGGSILTREKLYGDFNSTQAVAMNLRNLLGEKMLAEVPGEDWDRLDDFSEYLVALHGRALQTNEFKTKTYRDHLFEYDAMVKRFMQTQTVFVERESPVLIDLFGECRHVAPDYMMFHAAKTTLLFLVLVEIFGVYAKEQYGFEQKKIALNLFGRISEISPYGLVFYCANLTLLFAVMVKIYYSFIKDYAGDGANVETLGNQAVLQSFVAVS